MMDKTTFDQRVKELYKQHRKFIEYPNVKLESTNGIYCRFKYPILEAEHTPIFWRYDLNHDTNPHLMERLGVNCVFNSGAIYLNAHAMLKKEKVSCAGCHLDLLKALGGAAYREYFENRTMNIALTMGAGGMRENCQQCHLQEKDLKEKDNKKLMHAEHVTKPTARCFDCHRGWRGWKPGYLHVGLLQSGLAKK